MPWSASVLLLNHQGGIWTQGFVSQWGIRTSSGFLYKLDRPGVGEHFFSWGIPGFKCPFWPQLEQTKETFSSQDA
jgi:hypothetical protein